jgi:RNA polymerase sigma-70 factor (ECF subfamily)
VYSLACQITSLEEDAEEVLIDSFHQAWTQAGRYDSARATVTGWILNIARSRAIDQVRARRRWHQRKEKLAESIASFPVRSSASPELEAMRAEERTRLQQVIDSLPPDQRRAIELAYFAGLSHSQIAEQLGQPVGTIKTRLRLAMKKIRSAISGVEGMKP